MKAVLDGLLSQERVFLSANLSAGRGVASDAKRFGYQSAVVTGSQNR
jgi:hypothetical protein